MLKLKDNSSSLKVSDTSQHCIKAAESAIAFVEQRIPGMSDILKIGDAVGSVENIRKAISTESNAIANVIKAARVLDEARIRLEQARRDTRFAAEIAYRSTTIIADDLKDDADDR